MRSRGAAWGGTSQLSAGKEEGDKAKGRRGWRVSAAGVGNHTVHANPTVRNLTPPPTFTSSNSPPTRVGCWWLTLGRSGSHRPPSTASHTRGRLPRATEGMDFRNTAGGGGERGGTVVVCGGACTGLRRPYTTMSLASCQTRCPCCSPLNAYSHLALCWQQGCASTRYQAPLRNLATAPCVCTSHGPLRHPPHPEPPRLLPSSTRCKCPAVRTIHTTAPRQCPSPTPHPPAMAPWYLLSAVLKPVMSTAKSSASDSMAGLRTLGVGRKVRSSTWKDWRACEVGGVWVGGGEGVCTCAAQGPS